MVLVAHLHRFISRRLGIIGKIERISRKNNWKFLKHNVLKPKCAFVVHLIIIR